MTQLMASETFMNAFAGGECAAACAGLKTLADRESRIMGRSPFLAENLLGNDPAVIGCAVEDGLRQMFARGFLGFGRHLFIRWSFGRGGGRCGHDGVVRVGFGAFRQEHAIGVIDRGGIFFHS